MHFHFGHELPSRPFQSMFVMDVAALWVGETESFQIIEIRRDGFDLCFG